MAKTYGVVPPTVDDWGRSGGSLLILGDPGVILFGGVPFGPKMEEEKKHTALDQPTDTVE